MKKLGLLIFIVTLISCNPKQREIVYAEDDCIRCKMKLMDNRYGCEIVTSKGKIYTFDAIECMIPYLKRSEFKENSPAFILITPYTKPGTLFDAKAAFYLRSAKLPSPMGAFLTAFDDKQIALDFQTKNGGTIYSWEELYTNFSEIRKIELITND